jgi:hypothetical protein
MGDVYDTPAEAAADRALQEKLLSALGAWQRAMRRDACNVWCISGTSGCIYTWGDGKTWVMLIRCRSPRHWTAIKKRLGFCQLTQDCEQEGCLRLHRLPSLGEATVIREMLSIRKRAELGPGEQERRRALGKRQALAAGRANGAKPGEGPRDHAGQSFGGQSRDSISFAPPQAGREAASLTIGQDG